ncbi:secreted RxLR effector protein 161-like [Apium graveolens]|uniref:secreted RxLR effector protein 161-like n=1 Tax=Apium graveolens TaxID=4045 RepID=UPI003D79778A
MEGCKSTDTPMQARANLSEENDGYPKVDAHYYRSMIGCLMYLTASRPDIVQAMNFLSRFLHCANEEHLQAAKRVLRYIKGTVNYGVKYIGGQRLHFSGFADSDWAGVVDDMKSTSGFCFSFGSGVFNWCSKKQDIVAQSTAEAELVAATEAANHAI